MPLPAAAGSGRKILTAIASYAGIEGAAKGSNVLMVLSLASIFEPSAYGLIALYIALELIATEAILFGQNTMVLRIFGSTHSAGFGHRFAAATAIVHATTAVFLLAAAALPLASWLSIDDQSARTGPILLILGVGLQCQVGLYLAYLRATENTRQYSVIRIGSQLLKFVSVLGLAQFIDAPIAYPGGLLASNLLLVLCLALLPSKVRPIRAEEGIRIDRASVRKNVRFGLPIAVHGIIGATHTIIDRVQLARLADTEAVAIYSFASTQGTAVFFLINVVALALIPRFYQSSGLDESARRHLDIFLAVSLVGTAMFSLLVYFLVFPASLHFVATEYSAGREILPLIALAMAAQCVANYAVYKLTALNSLTLLPGITVAALGLNLVMSTYLIPKVGMLGAAYALATCETLYATLLVVLANFYARSRSLTRCS
jgi:O-antigen/teichoic acid export membrane protein